MFICMVCKKVFTAKRSLTRHMKLHSQVKEIFKCDDCEKTFSRYDSLKCHTEHHHSNNGEIFKCGKCSKVFNMKSNMN